MAAEPATIVWLLLHLVLLVAGLQEWVEQPSGREVNPGEEAVLACRLRGKKGDCRWERNGLPVGLYLGKYEWAASSPTEGDCSLRVREASLQYDAGDWVCQVTASSFMEKDTLISSPARLLVRAPPSSLYLGVPGEASVLRGPLVATSGQDLEVDCVAVGGNPAPRLLWYLGERRLEGRVEQEQDGRTLSRLRLPVSREDDGRVLKCEARHDALVGQLSTEAALTIQYAPRITSPAQQLSLGEGESALLLCRVTANPPASLEWVRQSTGQVLGEEGTEELSLTHLNRSMTDTYICQARNALGLSEPLAHTLTVQYGPSIKSVGPAAQLEKLLGAKLELTCEAEGQPAPDYTWIQEAADEAAVDGTPPPQIRGHNRRLVVHDLTYQDQGRYWCEASNTIGGDGGERLIAKSSPIQVEVIGRPAVVMDAGGGGGSTTLSVLTGRDAVVEVRFCADPQPEVTWHLVEPGMITAAGETSTLLLGLSDSGDGVRPGQLVADGPDCYRTSLRVEAAGPHLDSRAYVMRAANQHGAEQHTVHLRVGAGLAQETLIGGLVGGGLSLVVLLVAVVCGCRRCCCQPKEKKLKQQPDIERSV